MDPEWQARAESHLWPWYKEAVAMALTMAYVMDQCDTVSKGFLMHAQECNVRYSLRYCKSLKTDMQ